MFNATAFNVAVANMSEMTKAQMMINQYGANVTLVNGESCNRLYDALIQNYPCMKEAYCTPVGTTPGAFIFWMCVLMIVALFVGYYLRPHLDKQRKTGGKV